MSATAQSTLFGHQGTYVPAGALPQGKNSVDAFIPVARLSDMLLHPGQPFDYNGSTYKYPDIRLIYWAGGNPFHHQQDIGRLIRAWRKPETVIVHEPFWTSLARFGDIIFPCSTMLERNDIGSGMNDGNLIAMKQVLPPPGEAMHDFEIFAAVAKHLGFADEFTAGLTEGEWLRRIYAETEKQCAGRGLTLPSFDQFWEAGSVELPVDPPAPPICSELRANPASGALPTPSGRVRTLFGAHCQLPVRRLSCSSHLAGACRVAGERESPPVPASPHLQPTDHPTPQSTGLWTDEPRCQGGWP